MALTNKEMYAVIKPKKKGRLLRLSIVILILGLIAAGLYFFYFNRETVIEYNTAIPYIGTVEETVSASGTLNATNEVNIGSQISGTILEVLVDENDRVKKGDILAIINPETIDQNIARYQAQLNSAHAALKSAEISLINKKRSYERFKKLYELTGGKSPSVTELDKARMDYETAVADIDIRKSTIMEAQTALNSAKIDRKNSIIVSPVDGVVLTRSIDAGQTVAATYSTPELFIVAEDLEKMKLVVKVSEADVGKVHEGQLVNFTVDAYPDDIFSSLVDRVNMGSTASDDNIVSYETTIYIDNNDLRLRSGMSATADIVTARSENVTLIPVSALYFNPDTAVAKKSSKKPSMGFGPPRGVYPSGEVTEDKKVSNKGTLWLLKGNMPEKTEVLLGVSDGRNIEITSNNISVNTPVITGVKLGK